MEQTAKAGIPRMKELIGILLSSVQTPPTTNMTPLS